MPLTEEEHNTINRLSGLNVVYDVCNGKREGVEENIKNKITIDLFKALGWDKTSQMDFEHNVGSKSADIALVKNGNAEIIVETKSLEKKLEEHKSQGLEYARKKGIIWTVMTNGVKTQLYKSTIPGVPDSKNEPIFETSLRTLPERIDELHELIGEENIGEIEEKAQERVEFVKQKISEQEFLEQLEESKNDLANNLRDQFIERYQRDGEFTERVDGWAEENKFDTDWTWTDRFRNDPSFAKFIKQIVEDEGLKSTKTALSGAKGRYKRDDQYRANVNNVLRKRGVPVDWKDKLCNEGAYALVNRILFLRMYEDRKEGSESKINDNWISLLKEEDDPESVVNLLNIAFKEISEKFPGLYNSPLFDNTFVDDIQWSGNIIADIIERTKEHDFSEVGHDILGEVYQNHVPKEVRKALGQFYTDPAVVEYMLDQTEQKITPENEIFDPACGSGTFLVESYDLLIQKMKEDGWNEASAHEHILEENLYGIDIDSFATQLTVMNLLIKNVESPEGKSNILCGNTLTSSVTQWNQTDRAEKSLVNKDVEGGTIGSIISKGKKEGFDLIIGNPPYFHVTKSEKVPLSGEEYSHLLSNEYNEISYGRVNIASMFLKRSIEMLRDGGKVAFVLPKPLTFASTYDEIREYVIENTSIEQIVDLGKAWDEVGYEMIILILSKDQSSGDVKIVSEMKDTSLLAHREFKTHYINQEKFKRFSNFPMYLSDPDASQLENIWEKCWQNSSKLSDLEVDIFRGMGIQSRKDIIADSKKGMDYVPILRGGNIGGSKRELDERWNIDKNTEYVNEKELSSAKYDRLKSSKIVCKRLVSSDVKIDAAYDDGYNGKPYRLGYDTVTNIVNNDNSVLDKYILGILNSKIATVYLRDMVFNRSKLTMDLDEPHLGSIPIPGLPKNKENQLDQQDIVQVVDKIIELRNKLEDIDYNVETSGDYKQKQNTLSEKKEELNLMVAKAYNLTEEEIKEIEFVLDKNV